MKKRAILTLLTLIFVLVVLGTASAMDPTTERVSLTDTQGNDNSYSPSITPDGRYIAFESDSTNLVDGDTNGKSDVFVKDGWTGAITRISTTSTGGQGNDNSYSPSITPDGRYVAFYSYANNLVIGDTNGYSDVFVKDGWTGAITKVSTTSTGGQANDISQNPVITPNGRYIAFTSYADNLVSEDTNGFEDIFVKDGWTGAITRVSTTATGAQATGGGSFDPVITPDGRYVAFYSDSTNLVDGDTNGYSDVFVKDGWTGAITRASTSTSGTQGNYDSYNTVITPDGRYITFYSYADNLISGDTNAACDIFVKDGWTGVITRVNTNNGGTQGNDGSYSPSVTPDGRYIFFNSNASNLVASDTNDESDVFVKDGWTGAITRISTSAGGAQGNGYSYDPSITPDGRYIAFYSGSTNLVDGDTNGVSDVFVKDGWTGSIIRVSTPVTGAQSEDGGEQASITPDGRYVVFYSWASDLVVDDTNGCSDIFVHDNVTKRTIRVSTSTTGEQSNGGSNYPVITPDGRYIAFQSEASNLVSGDINGREDIFVKDILTGQITLISKAADGTLGNDNSETPSITPNGRYIVFTSSANNLVSGDTNGQWDLFVKDGWTGAITRVNTATNGEQGNDGSYIGCITPDGRYIAFESSDSNLVAGDTNSANDVFVKDGWTGAVTRVSTTSTGGQATGGGSYDPVITPDGRYVLFQSDASNLIAGDTNGMTDIFVKDGWTGSITRISTSASGIQGNGDSSNPSITSNGRYIVFESEADNLVSGDTNNAKDVFVKDGWTGQITRVSLSTTGVQGNGDSSDASITPDGRYIIFTSNAENLVANDTNGSYDVFVRKFW